MTIEERIVAMLKVAVAAEREACLSVALEEMERMRGKKDVGSAMCSCMIIQTNIRARGGEYGPPRAEPWTVEEILAREG